MVAVVFGMHPSSEEKNISKLIMKFTQRLFSLFMVGVTWPGSIGKDILKIGHLLMRLGWSLLGHLRKYYQLQSSLSVWSCIHRYNDNLAILPTNL